MTRRLVFLDTETTGLDPEVHEVWEIAYAVGRGDLRSKIVEHSLAWADPEALKIGGHTARCIATSHPFVVFVPEWEDELRLLLDGATLVGANPSFDAEMLLSRWGLSRSQAPWHYRLFDIEAYAAGVLGWDEPRGLAAIAVTLGIDEPDHTASQDVSTLRQCFYRLHQISRFRSASHSHASQRDQA